ncbi:valine--tRNA ligase [Roseivivax sediminis]|uniref:Valine--tRNA ligase n=1 Tax=Roseivivax sediminis TaxID=936889 RepID=A0A1I1VYK1_9RHOB|nr:valine--tRNA ligase [Roseivivax sediminis]SFD87984.1 valyl-tRNA synthetase [Roseivivax sediminis]
MAMDKTFDAAEAEARLYASWLEAGAFAAGANAREGAEAFSIMIPPPNVTGSLHMGHAFNNTLQDILVRWHRMRGHDTLWQPGQDHAGIATQMVVERELAKEGGQSRREMGREAFLKKVWEWKAQSGGTIINQLERLGASCDWSRNAFTMSGAPGAPAGEDGNFHDAVIRVFVEMYEKGLIYRGKRLVNWDPHFETAISDLEVENVETPGGMWHFKYPLADGRTYTYVEKDEDGNVLFEEERDYISIATTRPETMLGDGAVAVHPSDERYAPIVGALCEIPVGPKEHRRLIPIITDEYPDPDFGSGAVKITGAHDFNDYAVAQRCDIPCYRLMDTAAQMRADGAPYAEAADIALEVAKGERTLTQTETDAINLVPDDLRGLDRFEARKRVVEQITDEGLAVMVPPTDPRLGGKAPAAPEEGGEPRDEQLVPLVEHKPIMQPFGDRSKVVIEPMLTDQWFVDTSKIVGPALDAVRDGTVEILPERDKKVYFHWLENIEPWCISRQLWWGHQIPVWHTPGFGEEWRSFCAATEAEALEQMHATFGDDAEFILVEDEAAATDMLAEYFQNATDTTGVDQRRRPQAIPVFRDPDVLDTWFSSGLWPIGTLGWPEDTEELRRYFPTSVLITGFDIIFFWVARMMMMQYAIVGERPFDTVYVHALVRDEKGKKMSKSLGNVLDPIELIDEFGADAVRFTLSSMAAMGRDLKLSKDRVAGYRNFGTKLWNACRFAEMNGVFEGHSFRAEPPSAKATANAWIIGETAKVREEVDAAMSAFRFNDAANGLYAFVWGIVCDWYVEFAKPLLNDEATAAETRATMAWVLDRCLLMLHPFMPFVTEELWGTLGDRPKMLVHGDWPQDRAEACVTPEAEREMSWVIALIDGVRSARAQMRVPNGMHVPLLVADLDKAGRNAWAANEALIARLARVESLTETQDFPKGTVTIPVGGATFGMPLDGIVDVAAEMARLEKSLSKLQKEVAGLEKRVSNPKFVESAPDDVVEETRESLAARREEERTLEIALARLREIG